MSFQFAVIIQSLYAIIGLWITVSYPFESLTSRLVTLLLFVVIPLIGAAGTYFKNNYGIVVSMLFFVFQSIKHYSPDNVLPNITPITASFPVGDFSIGQGYLIDVFAIIMVLYLGWLFRLVKNAKLVYSD